MSIAVRTASVPVSSLDDVDAGGIAVRWWKPPLVTSVPFGVVWSHPSGQNERLSPSYTHYALVHAILNGGGAFIATAQHGTTSWGSDAATADVAAAATFLNSKVTVGAWIVMGGSMGGVPTCRTAAAGSTLAGAPIKGAAMVDAVCSLSNMYANATYTANIETAWGATAGTLSGALGSTGQTSLPTTASFPTTGTKLRVGNGTGNVEDVTTTGPSTGTAVPVTATTKTHASGEQVSSYPAVTSGKDPLLIPASTYGTVPWRFYTDPASDTTVPPASHATPFAAALLASGTPPPEAAIVTHKGGHLSSLGAQPRDLIAFIERCMAR